jgi:hypothetical protein
MRPNESGSSIWRGRSRGLAGTILLLCMAGCSLLSVKTPERPLSTRDLNARILTREYSAHFIATVAAAADDISAAAAEPDVRMNALRWKIGAGAASQRAATRMAPMMGLLDTWALAVQMKQYLSPESPGSVLFAEHQETALAAAQQLDGAADALAQRLLGPDDLKAYRQFVQGYAHDYPLVNLDFKRPSVVELWSRQSGGGVRLVDSLGTIPEAMADVSDRLQMYNETVPSQTLWKTQLALQQAGYSGGDVRVALKELDDRLAKMANAAESAPQLVHGAVADVRRSVIDVLDRVDRSSAAMIEALRAERIALSADVRTEREAVLAAADMQRKAIVQDAARLADQVVESSGQQIRSLAREVLLLTIALAIVVLGLPFAAGYFVGHARGRR